MPRRTQEQPDVPPFEFRPGVTTPPLGGMYRRGDPAQIPVHKLHLGVNIRLADNEAGSRPGLARVEDAEAEEGACITGIFEIEDFSVGAYITQLGWQGLDDAGDANPPSPFQILQFNEEREPVQQNYWDENSTFPKPVPSPWRTSAGAEDVFQTFQPYNDTLLVSNFTDVYQAEFSEDLENPRLDLSILFSIPLPAGDIVSMTTRRERVDNPRTGDEFEQDVLYLGTDDGEIFRWDGATVELVHTLASGGPMQIITWRGTGLVAAGDNAGGFSWQEQPGFAWQDQAWGTEFHCNGLCEWLSEVVFVGDDFNGTAAPDVGKALRWAGGGAPTIFSTAAGTPTRSDRYRTPIVVGGALYWLHLNAEAATPPAGSAFVEIARATSFASVTDPWLPLGNITVQLADQPGFFIPYAGRMLMIYGGFAPSSEWTDAATKILLIDGGPTGNINVVYEWPKDGPDADNDLRQLTGVGHEAIPL